MIPTLQLKRFGSPQISYQGQPLTGFVSAKVRALLVYLAVTVRPHSLDHLAELLWPDTPTSTGTNLRNAPQNLQPFLANLLMTRFEAFLGRKCQLTLLDYEIMFPYRR